MSSVSCAPGAATTPACANSISSVTASSRISVFPDRIFRVLPGRTRNAELLLPGSRSAVSAKAPAPLAGVFASSATDLKFLQRSQQAPAGGREVSLVAPVPVRQRTHVRRLAAVAHPRIECPLLPGLDVREHSSRVHPANRHPRYIGFHPVIVQQTQ